MQIEGDAIKIEIFVDTERIRDNLAQIKKQVGTKVLLMVKADAYGHGLLRVAKATCDVVDAFGVATVEEARVLRENGVGKDVLVCIVAPDELEYACKLGAIVSLHCFAQLDKLVELAKNGRIDCSKMRLHLKVDSGMHRFGFDSRDIKRVCETLIECGYFVEGVFSHLRDGTARQKNEFDRCAEIAKRYFPQATLHLASSHSLSTEELCYDMVRVGISAYEGAMSVVSRVVETRFAKAGEIVGYGTQTLEKDCNIAYVFGGYADGVCRENPSSVIIDGKACNVVGNVCMDVFAVDTGEYRAQIGEKAVLLDGTIAEEVARQRKTIDYCVYTSFGRSRSVCKSRTQEELQDKI